MMHIREVKIVTLSSNVPTDHIERKLFFIGLSCKSPHFLAGLVSFFFIGLSCKSPHFLVELVSFFSQGSLASFHFFIGQVSRF